MNKKKRNNYKILAVIVALGVTSMSLFLLNDKMKDTTQISIDAKQDYHFVEMNGKSYEYNSSLITILLLGVDSSNSKDLGQADFLTLLLMDRDKKTMKLLSISRDTMTDIQLRDAAGNDLGWDTQHIALSYAYGTSKENGGMLTMDAVSKLLNGIPVINFVAGDVTMIALFQNIVGDLTVTIPDDSLSYLKIGWESGSEVRLTADNTERFLRSRNIKEAYSSETRRMRQKVYMEAYLKKMKFMLETNFNATVKNMAAVYDQLTTNLSLNELETFAEMVMMYTFDDDGFYNLSGKEKQGGFHDEYWLDENAKNDLIVTLFYHEK